MPQPQQLQPLEQLQPAPSVLPQGVTQYPLSSGNEEAAGASTLGPHVRCVLLFFVYNGAYRDGKI